MVIAAPADLKRAIGLKLNIIARQMRMAFDQSAGQAGVTRSQWTLIAIVARNPGATQRFIADALEMTEAAAGRLIDRLCGDGLLVRTPRKDDRRAYCINLTPLAEPLIASLGHIARLREEECFRDMSKAQLVQLDQLLDLISKNVVDAKREPSS